MSRKRSLILAISLLSLMAISGPVGAAEPAVDPDTSVSVENATVAPESAGATPIQPDPTIINPRPNTWDRIVVSSDGLTLDIYFWMGIEEVLHRREQVRPLGFTLLLELDQLHHVAETSFLTTEGVIGTENNVL